MHTDSAFRQWRGQLRFNNKHIIERMITYNYFFLAVRNKWMNVEYNKCCI